MNVLNLPVLQVNTGYEVIGEKTVEEAIKDLASMSVRNPKLPVAYGLVFDDGRFEPVEWDLWTTLDPNPKFPEYVIRTAHGQVRAPTVIMAANFHKPYPKIASPSRMGILTRDNFTCQYCHQRFPPRQLTLDHLVPRCMQGKSTWENLVAACVRCNSRKDDKPLSQLRGWRLLRRPYRPRPVMPRDELTGQHPTWVPFLGS